MNASQQIFVLFFAIFWGTSSNAWPRWKPFHWTFFGSSRRITMRVILSMVLLNVIPVIYFAWAIQRLAHIGSVAPNTKAVLFGVVPAFAVFGLYRFWFSVIELFPTVFYYRDAADMARAGKDYLICVEPSIESLHLKKAWWWWKNAFFGLLYVAISSLPLFWV